MTTARPTPPLLTAAAGGLVGLAAFASSLGFAIVNPAFIDWLLAGGDTTVHFLGWHMFRRDEWHMPLGVIANFGYPVGTSIGNTDSIPILAVPFKVFNAALGPDFQYIGLWLLACYLLQGAFGALLTATATPRLVLHVLGAVLFVTAPPLLHRVGHPALTAHWLLIAGLWLYFSVTADLDASPDASPNPRYAFVTWTCLTAIVAATHPYLGMMMVCLIGAFYARAAIVAPSRMLRTAVAPLVMLGAVFLLIFWQAGYLTVGEATNLQSGGFGTYSFNLLGLVMPLQGSSLFEPGPFAMASEDQYEGYAYLGAGTLLLAIAALAGVAVSRRWRPRLRLQHVPLVLACVVLTLLALSPRITAGGRVLLEYSESLWGPLTLFRASGRMIWPVYYAVIYLIVRTAARTLRAEIAIAVFVAAAAIQAADIRGPYRNARTIAARPWENPLTSGFWRVVPGHYRHLTLVPTNVCAHPDEALDYAPFAVVAGRHDMTVNGAFAARYDTGKVKDYCARYFDELARGVVDPVQLYVLRPDLAARFLATAQTAVACLLVDGVSACFEKTTYAKWQERWNITRPALPDDNELTQFRASLEAEYRDRLKRPAAPIEGTIEQRLALLAEYLALRRTGCQHIEAGTLSAGIVRSSPQARVCDGFGATISPMGTPDETHDALRSIAEALRDQRAVPTPTHVDLEGEAVWVHRYLAHRLDGHSDGESKDMVLREIRAIAAQ